MATFVIVSKDAASLGPNEIRAGGTISVSNGDTYIIAASANDNTTFVAKGGIPADFEIQINASNANVFDIKVESNLTPSMTIADGANLSGVKLDAKSTVALEFTAGNDVSFGQFEGSTAGPNTISIGSGFTTLKNWKLGAGGDTLIAGDGGTFQDIDVGDGSDTVTFGDQTTIRNLDTKKGDDSVTLGNNLVANDIKTDDGNDAIRLGDNADLSKVDGGSGNDAVVSETENLPQSNVENTQIVCFAPGTMIRTPDGLRAVEGLEPGDLVDTVDHGPQPIRWIRCGNPLPVATDVDGIPVQIKAGALGINLPCRDLVVSPQHCILVGGAGQLEGAFDHEALAPAKALTAIPGIRRIKGRPPVSWIHFACDRHEIVIANGCLTESLLLGPMVVNGLSAAEWRAVNALFGPALSADAALNGPPARKCLSVGAVRRQIAKCLEEDIAVPTRKPRKSSTLKPPKCAAEGMSKHLRTIHDRPVQHISELGSVPKNPKNGSSFLTVG